MATSNKRIDSLGNVNSLVEWITINLAWILLFAITILNIVQVFYRYVLNNALSWTEEASRGSDLCPHRCRKECLPKGSISFEKMVHR